MPHPNTLENGNTVLLIVDVQEAFRDPIGNFAIIASNIARAATGFGMLRVPVIVTEQYPKGLGPTAEEIRFSLPEEFHAFEKTTFSAFGSADVRIKLEHLGTKQVVLCGVETHVCVNQTAHELMHAGYEVHLLTDCVGSRFDHDKEAGLAKMKASGVIPSSVELALFELLGDAGHEKFKEIQAVIK
ncbi:MAG: isochorismatase family protein [Acidobacteriota bacterium]